MSCPLQLPANYTNVPSAKQVIAQLAVRLVSTNDQAERNQILNDMALLKEEDKRLRNHNR